MSEMEAVRIEWMDAASASPGWMPRDAAEDFEPARCVNIGFMVDRTKTHVVLAGGYNDQGEVSEVTTIPVAWVTKLSKL